jgi:hypothetical protein
LHVTRSRVGRRGALIDKCKRHRAPIIREAISFCRILRAAQTGQLAYKQKES